MKRTFHAAVALSLALGISMLVAPAASGPPSGPQTILDRHHVLYGHVIPGPTDAPAGIPGELYVCLSCHAIDTGSGTSEFIVERNCRACHDPDRHHSLDGSVISYQTEAPYSQAGDLYVCLSCHDLPLGMLLNDGTTGTTNSAFNVIDASNAFNRNPDYLPGKGGTSHNWGAPDTEPRAGAKSPSCAT